MTREVAAMEGQQVNLLVALVVVLACSNLVESQTTQRPTFPPLKQSDLLKAKAFLRWLVDNSTENATKTFNAGFIRLAFHDCVGGCDGCLNLRNPSNVGLGFYKTPLDKMYTEFIHPMMSRADWYALAGLTAVEYAAERTPCTGFVCVPPMEFKWGRKDCVNETRLFRRFPGPDNDPRDTIRRTFRMNLLEITALMGAHTLGKNHANGATWVNNETMFDNQYFKDLIDADLKWRKGVRQGAGSNTWSHSDTGNNIMLTSDFFMGFEVGTTFADCNNNPVLTCRQSNTFSTVERFAADNDYWLTNFGAAFSVMLNSGNFGKLKSVEWDTFDETFTGELFPPKIETATNETLLANRTGSLDEISNVTVSNGTMLMDELLDNIPQVTKSDIESKLETTTATLSVQQLINVSPDQEHDPPTTNHSSGVLLSPTSRPSRAVTESVQTSIKPTVEVIHTTQRPSTTSTTISRTRAVVTRFATAKPGTTVKPPPRVIIEHNEGDQTGDSRVGYMPSQTRSSRRALRRILRQRNRQLARLREGRKKRSRKVSSRSSS